MGVCPFITKTYIVLAAIFVLSIDLSAQKAAIIESQSVYSSHNMDTRWLAECSSLGLNTQIFPYDYLNDNCLISKTDIIVVASAVNTLSNLQINNLIEFVASGGNLFIQSEWNFQLVGNKAFQAIADSFGDYFSWTDSVKIQLAPLTVEAPLNNNYHNVESIDYFWSGASADHGTAFQPILTKGNSKFGFIYQPSQLYSGKVITVSDQDWLRLNLSDDFLENVIHYLKYNLVEFPEVFIESTTEIICLGENIEFNATIDNNPTGIQYQWYLNGNEIIGATTSNFQSATLQDGDILECAILNSNGCPRIVHTSNPILITPIFPINISNISLEIVQEDSCTGGTTLFTILEDNPDNVEIISYQWELNGNILGNTNTPEISIKDLSTGDVLVCNFSIQDPCQGQIWLSTPDHNIELFPVTNPTVTFVNPENFFCEGQTPTFTITGNDWGPNPTIEWSVNGEIAQQGLAEFSPTGLTTGNYIVSASLISNTNCPSVTPVVANTSFQYHESATMTATLTASKDSICANEAVTFYLEGENMGADPIITWSIDGVAQSNTSTSLQITEYTEGLNITAEITSTVTCITNSTLALQAPAVTVNENLTPDIAIDANPMEVCSGSEVTFHASGNHWGSSPEIMWYVGGQFHSNGDATFVITPEANTFVQARVISDYACADDNIAVSETEEVTISDLQIELISATPEHCSQEDGQIEVQVNGGIGTVSGEWIHGSTDLHLENLSSGNYMYIATDAAGCQVFQEVDLDFEMAPEIQSLDISQPSCDRAFGEASLQLENMQNLEIIWMDDQFLEVAQGPSASDLKGGNYIVEVMDEYGCVTEAALEIEEVQTLQILPIETIEITLGESFDVEPIVFSNDADLEFVWETPESINCIDCTEIEDTPKETSNYKVTITNSYGCSATEEFLVRVKKAYEVFLPNAFSPNGDGNNDHYMPFAGIQVANIDKLSIFNRWGELVYQVEDPTSGYALDGWDGRINGKLAPVGTYVAMAEITYQDGEQKVQTTDLQLLR